ncbi:MAG: hypothetical protein WDW36_005423 [Sanguina aurantia]
MAWRYTVSVPQYIQNKDNEGELITLFRVNVLLQAPDASSSEDLLAKPPFFVLRRFSQFRQLFEQLRAALPDTMKQRALLPPSKHSIHFGSNQDLLGRRREELERWLWKLIATPEVARSLQLKGFLEFEKACSVPSNNGELAGAAPSSTPSALTSPVSSLHNWRAQHGSVASSEAGDFDDQRSESSYTTTPTPRASTSLLHGMDQQPGGQLHHSLPQEPRRGTPAHQSSSPATTPSSTAASTANGIHRLGLPLEQRGLSRGGRDLRGAVAEVALLEETNRLLAGRLSEVQFQLEGGRSAREVELEREAAEAEKHTAAMASTISGLQGVAAGAESQRAALYEAQMSVSELSAQLVELTTTSSSRAQMLSQQLSTLQAQLDESRQEKKELFARMHEWDLSPSQTRPAAKTTANSATNSATHPSAADQTTPASGSSSASPALNLASLMQDSSIEALTASLDSSSKARGALELELLSSKAVVTADREKARADQTVLAKEIKRLRGELASSQSTAANDAAALQSAGAIQIAALQSAGASEAAAALLAAAAAAAREADTAAHMHVLETRCAELAGQLQLLQSTQPNGAAKAAGAPPAAAAGAAQAADLSRQLKSADSRCAELTAQLHMLQSSLTELTEGKAVSDTRAVASAAAATDAEVQALAAGAGHVRAAAEQQETLFAVVAEASARADAAEQRLALADAQLASAAQQVAEAQARCSVLATELAQLQRSTEEASQAHLHTLCDRTAALEHAASKAAASAAMAATLSAQVSALEAQLADARLAAASPGPAIAEKLAAVASLQASLGTAQASLSSSEATATELQASLETAQRSLLSSDAAMAELRAHTSVLELSLERSQAGCLSLHESGRALARQVSGLQQAGGALQREALESAAQHGASPHNVRDGAPPLSVLHEGGQDVAAVLLLLLQQGTSELESLVGRSHGEARELDSLRQQLTAAQSTAATTTAEVSTPSNSSTCGAELGKGHMELPPHAHPSGRCRQPRHHSVLQQLLLLLRSRVQELESQLAALQEVQQSLPDAKPHPESDLDNNVPITLPSDGEAPASPTSLSDAPSPASDNADPAQQSVAAQSPVCTGPSHLHLQQHLESTTSMITDLQAQIAALEAQLLASASERAELASQLHTLQAQHRHQGEHHAHALTAATASAQAASLQQQRELQLGHDSRMAVAANQRVQLQQELAGARFELSASRTARPSPHATPPAPSYPRSASTGAASTPAPAAAAAAAVSRAGGELSLLGDDLGDLLSFEGMDVSPQVLHVPPPPPGPPPLLELEPDHPQRPAMQLVQRENDTLHRNLSELQRRFDELSAHNGDSAGTAVAAAGAAAAAAESSHTPPLPPPPPPPSQLLHQPSLQRPSEGSSTGAAVSEIVLTLVQSVEAVIAEARALLTLLHQSNSDALASACTPPSPAALDTFLAAQSAITTSMHSIMATATSELGVAPLMPSLPEGLHPACTLSMTAMEASLRTLLADALQLSCRACLAANEMTCDKYLGQVFAGSTASAPPPPQRPRPPPPPPHSTNMSSAGQQQAGLWPAQQQHQQQQQQQVQQRQQQVSNESQQGTSLWGVASTNNSDNSLPSRRGVPPPPQQAGYGPPAPTTLDPFAGMSGTSSVTSGDSSGMNVRSVFNRMLGGQSASTPSPTPSATHAPHTPQQQQQQQSYPAPAPTFATTSAASSHSYAPPGFTSSAPSPPLPPTVRSGGPHMNGGGSSSSSSSSVGQATGLSGSGQLHPPPNPNVLGGLGQRMSDAVSSLGLGNPLARPPTADGSGWGLPGSGGSGGGGGGGRAGAGEATHEVPSSSRGGVI